MNCVEFESAVEHAVEARAPLAEAAVAHAKVCSHCQQIWALNQQLDQIIGVWQQSSPPAGFVDSVIAKLTDPTYASEPRDLSDLGLDLRPQPIRTPQCPFPVRRSTRTQMVAVVSMASCLLVAVIGLLYLTSESNPLANQLAKSDAFPIEVTTDASYNVSDRLAGVISGIRSEYREIASGTTSAAREIVTSIPLRVAESVLPDAEDFEMIPDANDVKRILQPIGARVGSAFSFLLETVPSEIPAG